MSGSSNPHKSPSSSSMSSTSSGPNSGAIKKREKRAVALYLKEEISKPERSKNVSDHLDYPLDPQRPIDDPDNIDSCKWIIAGGLTYEDFGKKVREYDNSVMCGLVWTANFVAYRCRTCGISPCMSICSDCFQAGNHEGHDYNMFRSHSGGACDCGDASVMRPEGFCSRHGNRSGSQAYPEAPAELMAMAKEMMPRLFLRFLYHLREEFELQVRESSSTFIWRAAEVETFLGLLQSLSDMGAAMRRVMAEALVDEEQYKKSTSGLNPESKEHRIYAVFLEQLNSHGLRYPLNFDKYKARKGMDQKLEYTTIIEELLFWVLRYEFPQQLVTFLLGLLPDDLYKESFAKAFVKHYSRVSVVLMEAKDRMTVANRFVHISVQLFSNENVAVFLTEHHNLLLTFILSLSNMMQSIQVASLLEDPDMKSNFHWVVNCDSEIMRDHCYWPVVSDLINVLSHRKIAHSFLRDPDLVTLWLDLLSSMQGMNLNTRELRQHVEFEPDSYYAAFSAELEMSASPMWSLLMHCQTPDTRQFILGTIQAIVVSLQDWFEAINFKDSMKPNPYQLTFHLPLHRYLAMFIMTAVKCHDADLASLLPEESLLKQIMMHPLQIQVCLAQIYAGMWVRNGIQIKGQAMTYIQCHFCYSLSDADLFLLQLCAIKLDPDYFVLTVLERFRIMDWLSYCPELASTSSLVDPDHKLAMVEGALSLFSALLGIQTYLGISESDLMRKEMAALLCMSDRQHSTLMDLMPEKTGVSGLAKELFEPTLKEVKLSGVKSSKNYKKTTSLWPPFKIDDNVHNSFRGIYKLVNCKAMHAFLFSVLHKALIKDKSVPESILYQTIHLLNLCLHFAPKTFPNRFMSKRITVKESIISVLLKLYTKLGGSSSYRPQQTSPSSKDSTSSHSEVLGGDGQFYIAAFLDRLYSASSNASRIIDETRRSLNMTKVKAGPSDIDKDSKRRKAWNRQQKLMAEFASKQKAFMESAMDDASDSEEGAPSASASAAETTKHTIKEYDCAICNQTTPSTGQRPVGLVIFLQASSVLGHRHQNDQEYSLNLSESQIQRHRYSSCGKVNKRKMDILLKHFEEKSVELSVNIGWEGGVMAQTCGHYLHLDCHRSYLESLRSQSQADVLAVNKREYWCPLCRQLSNSVIPMVPEESRTMLVKPVSSDPRQMVLDIAEMMVKRRIGRTSWLQEESSTSVVNHEKKKGGIAKVRGLHAIPPEALKADMAAIVDVVHDLLRKVQEEN
ncbi:E3 ubiquitin-protein ligase ubr3-like [Plakobranchus ocellatus]|uniref:E3 ubiquitin-protein ligase n=1 Tax=Plakobranchus ocellatus TaxID=259542 RepID=A0AAV4DCX7_9GAST|nr:E3 ubiquitin-protein ligase ubr3-like [Plakobranchus ocellatus]